MNDKVAEGSIDEFCLTIYEKKVHRMQHAIKSYNWKGEVIGYQYNNSWVPLTKDGYYRVLLEEIQGGRCQVVEPTIATVEKVYDRYGNMSGYSTIVPFVPIDDSNSLYRLIHEQIKSGECKVIEAQSRETKQIDSLIICIQFDTPWGNIDKPCELDIDYPIGGSLHYKVRIFNVENANANFLKSLYNFYSLVGDDNLINFLPPSSHAVMEISIPISNLKKNIPLVSC